MAKTHVAVILSSAARTKLTGWTSAHGTPQQVVKRCQIVLRDADGASDVETAATLGLSRHTCRLWRQRFVSGGPDALWKVAPGRGRKPDGARQQRIVTATLERKPKGQTHWSTRTLARDLGVSPTLVRQVWQAHQLKPHLEKTFKVSRDPRFLQKLTDVVGLYLHAPERALVLCVDEKSQIQALDRTQPGLPLKKGRCGTMTHDYKRNGTTTLFAALEVLSGKVVGQCQPRHRHQEFIRFLKTLDQEFAAPLELHLVLDNYGTHQEGQSPRLAGPTSPLCPALHPDEFELAQPGRTVVWRADPQGAAARCLRQHPRLGTSHCRLSRKLE
jgi:transposase